MNRTISLLLTLFAVVAYAGVGTGVGHAQDGASGTLAEYEFGADDILEITVFGKPEFTGEVAVDFRGMIQAPLVGEVQAAGRSPSNLGSYLTERYQLIDPSITEVLVSVVEYNSRTITVVGEVRSPGPYGFVEIPDLWAVLLTAGGPRADADLSQVQIVRGKPQPGEPGSITIDLSAGIAATRNGTLPQLYPTDKIFVPSADDVPIGDQDFQIIGAVRAPGTYRISVATNVIEAISASGGPDANADMSNVYLTRTVGQSTRSWRLNMEDYLFAAQTPVNLDLLAGDTITVPERSPFLRSFSAVWGLIVPVISIAVTLAWATSN